MITRREFVNLGARRSCRAGDNQNAQAGRTPANRLLHTGLPRLGMEDDFGPGRATWLRRD